MKFLLDKNVYRFVESGWCLEHISDFFQIPLFLKLALPDDGQLAHQIFDVSAEMLDGLQTIMEVPAKEEQTRLKMCLAKMKTRARSVPYLVIFQFSIQNYLTYLILSAEITWFIWIFTLKMIQEVNYRTAIGLAKRFSVACMMYIHNWKHDGFSLFGISLVLKRLEQKK